MPQGPWPPTQFEPYNTQTPAKKPYPLPYAESWSDPYFQTLAGGGGMKPMENIFFSLPGVVPGVGGLATLGLPDKSLDVAASAKLLGQGTGYDLTGYNEDIKNLTPVTTQDILGGKSYDPNKQYIETRQGGYEALAEVMNLLTERNRGINEANTELEAWGDIRTEAMDAINQQFAQTGTGRNPRREAMRGDISGRLDQARRDVASNALMAIANNEAPEKVQAEVAAAQILMNAAGGFGQAGQGMGNLLAAFLLGGGNTTALNLFGGKPNAPGFSNPSALGGLNLGGGAPSLGTLSSFNPYLGG